MKVDISSYTIIHSFLYFFSWWCLNWIIVDFDLSFEERVESIYKAHWSIADIYGASNFDFETLDRLSVRYGFRTLKFIIIHLWHRFRSLSGDVYPIWLATTCQNRYAINAKCSSSMRSLHTAHPSRREQAPRHLLQLVRLSCFCGNVLL